MPRPSLVASAVLLFVAAAAPAQPGGPSAGTSSVNKLPKSFAALADVSVSVTPFKVRRGETVTISLTVRFKDGAIAYTYPFFPADPQQVKNRFQLLSDELILLPGATDPPGSKPKPRDPNRPDGPVNQVFDRTVTWEFPARVSPTATPGRKSIDLGKTTVQVCGRLNPDDEDKCITVDADRLPHLVFEVTDEPPVSTPPPSPAEVVTEPASRERPAPPTRAVPVPPAASPEGPKTPKPLDVYTAELDDIRGRLEAETGGPSDRGTTRPEDGLLAFVTTAALWGLISLITPCVFPMIPITVSIFLKHAHGSLRERIKLAGVYCLTIIAVLGVSAFALLKFMAWLSAHPATNVLLGILFLVLALSLFGMYEITLPNFLARRLQARQARGGMLGTVFGALAFTVISFTCVAPFLGGFAGISAADAATGGRLIAVPTLREVLGGLAFATAFAAPFFVLALVPSLLKALPKSGGWLDSVKVVMGFLELAAALKFFRTAEVRVFSPAEFFTYELVLAGWVAICLACSLYLFNAYRLPHDEETPNIGVPRLLFAILFLSLGVYLLPAVFRGSDGSSNRPPGAVYAWVQAFLLPESDNNGWGTDLKAALEQARRSGKPVLVDFTGVTCTNCKYNEETVFPVPAVREELDQFERVRLYTDEVPAAAYGTDPGKGHREDEAGANRRFQEKLFGDIALPLYAVLVPTADGKVRLANGTFKGRANSPYEGKINDPADFAAWLREARSRARP